MAPTVFGLHLGPPDMLWSKFGSKYMFGNTDYHLRRTKFVVYQLAMILCVVSESLGTAALSDYVDQQDLIQSINSQGQTTEYNNDYIGAASYNIWCGIFVAFVFGAAFFFDLFWPERHEDRGIRMAWKGCSVMACLFIIADTITLTVLVSSRQAYVYGVTNPEELDRLINFKSGVPLVYRKNGRAVASLVFLWLGLPFVIYSTYIMWISIIHDDRHGPFAAHVNLDRKTNGIKNITEDTWGSDEPGMNMENRTHVTGGHEGAEAAAVTAMRSEEHFGRTSNAAFATDRTGMGASYNGT